MCVGLLGRGRRRDPETVSPSPAPHDFAFDAFIEDVVFSVVEALDIPVLIAALVALAISSTRSAPGGGDPAAQQAHHQAAGSRDRRRVRLACLGNQAEADAAPRRWKQPGDGRRDQHADGARRTPGADNRIAKCLADFDLVSLRRLERTRLLVRAGPALGLMGTLIPLAPALSGLAKGNIKELTDNLRVAFSVTVLGLMIGVIAFSISLIRDRLYAQDLSDIEIIAAVLTELGGDCSARTPAAPTPTPARKFDAAA